MWWALLTKKSEELQNKLQKQLLQSFVLRTSELKKSKADEKLAIYNSTIKKVHTLNIEYKYKQATHSMIHDGKSSQVSSMIQALQFIGILKA